MEPVTWNSCPSEFKLFTIIVIPPISPLVAVILPVIFAFDAVICPLDPFNVKVPDEASKSVPILNQPIVPVCAVISPDIETSPLLSTEKLPVFISKAPLPPSASNLI